MVSFTEKMKPEGGEPQEDVEQSLGRGPLAAWG